MKKHNLLGVLAVVMMASLLIFTVSCGDKGEEGSDAALLTSIKIVDKDNLDIPSVMPQATFKDDTLRSQFIAKQDNLTFVTLDKTTDLTDAKIDAKVSPKAKVAFAIMQGNTIAENFASKDTLTFTTAKNTLVVRVTAENGKQNYYVFRIQTKSTEVRLSSVTIAGVTATTAAAGTAPSSTNRGKVSISTKISQGADIVVTPNANAKLTALKYDVKANAAAPVDADWKELTKGTDSEGATTWTATGVDFSDGNRLHFQVTAEDTSFIRYYIVEVEVGRNASLSMIKIDDVEVISLGTPLTANAETDGSGWVEFNEDDLGYYQAERKAPVAGFSLEIIPEDEDALIWYKAGFTPSLPYTDIDVGDKGSSDNIGDVDSGELLEYEDGKSVSFPGGQTHMVVKVVSTNNLNTSYYKVNVITRSWTPIFKGTIDFTKADSVIIADSQWDKAPPIPVERLNLREGSPMACFKKPETSHTQGEVKLLWDDGGLYAYWKVTVKSFEDNGATVIRKVQPDTTQDNGSAHNFDSIELFLNERLQKFTTGSYGLQYRVSSNKFLSGDPIGQDAMTTVQTDVDVKEVLEASNTAGKIKAWVDNPGTATTSDGGYSVVMYVPWGFVSSADADKVFDAAAKKVKPGAEIGIEFQINACSEEGTRDAILTWNGVQTQAYRNVGSFGLATLYENVGDENK